MYKVLPMATKVDLSIGHPFEQVNMSMCSNGVHTKIALQRRLPDLRAAAAAWPSTPQDQPLCLTSTFSGMSAPSVSGISSVSSPPSTARQPNTMKGMNTCVRDTAQASRYEG